MDGIINVQLDILLFCGSQVRSTALIKIKLKLYFQHKLQEPIFYYLKNTAVMTEYVSNEYMWCQVHTGVDMRVTPGPAFCILSNITCYSTVAAFSVVMSCVLSNSYFYFYF